MVRLETPLRNEHGSWRDRRRINWIMSQRIAAACRLCRNVTELQNSHFLPAAMYKHMHFPGDTSHIIMDRQNLAVKNPRTSKQVRDHILCVECEDRFSKGGERWVMTNGFHPSGSVPLQAALMNATPAHHATDFSAYPGTATPGVELEPLVYFAASVFWRAAVHDWGDAGYRLQLGSRYQEGFRQYLMGVAPFPNHVALLIEVSSAATLLEIAVFPFGGKVAGTYFIYQFNIPGVGFTLFLGQRIPGAVFRICTVHSPKRWIFRTHGNTGLLMAVDLMAERIRTLSATFV